MLNEASSARLGFHLPLLVTFLTISFGLPACRMQGTMFRCAHKAEDLILLRNTTGDPKVKAWKLKDGDIQHDFSKGNRFCELRLGKGRVISSSAGQHAYLVLQVELHTHGHI